MSYLGKAPAPVVAGGTGNASFATTHAPICTGTSSTNPFELASTGLPTAGFVLTSNGSGATPSFKTASASGAVTDLTGNSGGAVAPTAGNINVVGDGTTVTIAGNPGTSTLTVSTTGASLIGVTDSASPYTTVLGSGAGTSIAGTYNAGLGYQALNSVTSGIDNTALGGFSLNDVTTGSGNTCIGYLAGNAYKTSETGNICIGFNCNGTTGESNALHIGDTNGTISTAYIAGIAGVTIANTAAVLISTVTGQLGTVISSERFKDNIEDIGDESEVLYKLRPVKYTLKEHPEYGMQTGLIAEEVQKVAPRLVALDKEGKPSSVAYHELPALLLAEIQKLNARIAALEGKRCH